jgi:four helix bundle protein
MAENVVKDKSYKFAVRIVGLYKYLTNEKKEYVLSRQVLRSGSSIGANIKEATQAESRADFIHKMATALKEASETEYWLELLKETDFLNQEYYDSIQADCQELLRLLTSIVKSSKQSS